MNTTELKAAFTKAYEDCELATFEHIKAVKAMFKNFYVVPYEVIGERFSGTYLVKAKNKAEAKRLVRAVYDDYVCRYPATLFLDHCDEMDENIFVEVESAYDAVDVNPEDIPFGFVHCLESGT